MRVGSARRFACLGRCVCEDVGEACEGYGGLRA